MPGDVPSTLGPYEIRSLLGRGGTGEVYRAWDARLGRPVAIKVLSAAFSAEPERLRRFEQEARAAAALNHPNIVAVYDVGKDNGVPYVVSELLEGTTLRDVLGGGRMPLRKALDCAIQVATGLAAAHERGIVHRDIKPENLFVTPDGLVKILDFGLAKLFDTQVGVDRAAAAAGNQSTARLLLGTAGYMSPEQVRGEAVDHRTDIFSLGATFYEMLSGRRAFPGDSAIDALHAILNDDPAELVIADNGRGAGLSRIVRRCLEKESAQRFQSARDLAFTLKQLTDSAVVGVAVSASPSRGRPWIVAAVLGAIVLGGAALRLARPNSPIEAPSFRQLTFQYGQIEAARFAPDGQNVLSEVAWDGQAYHIQSTRVDSRASNSLELSGASLMSVSKAGELALLMNREAPDGTLARAPIGRGGMRAVQSGVFWADWGPDGSLAAIRVEGVTGRDPANEWLEFPLGHRIFEDPSSIMNILRVSPDGRFVAVQQEEDGGSFGQWVTIIDRNGQVMSRSTRRPQVNQVGLAWTPDSREVWFSAAGEALISEIRGMTVGGTERVVYRTPGSIRIEDIAPDGSALVVRDVNRADMRLVDVRARTERDMTWFGYSRPRGLSNDGRYVVFNEFAGSPTGGPTAYIRSTDGQPAILLGEGTPLAVSPDAQWVLAKSNTAETLGLVPTGVGDGRTLPRGSLARIAPLASWTPDGRHVVFLGSEAGKKFRVFEQAVDRGDPIPVTPEGASYLRPIVSPDSSTVIAGDAAGHLSTYALDGGASPIAVVGSVPGDEPLVWSADKGTIWVRNVQHSPSDIYGVDLRTGRRSFWYAVPPSDPASTILHMLSVHLSADGRTLVYGYSQHLSDLYVAQGLR